MENIHPTDKYLHALLALDKSQNGFSEIDHEISMQSFYDAGFVFGSTRMNFETVGLPKRKRHHEDDELRVQKKDSGGRK